MEVNLVVMGVHSLRRRQVIAEYGRSYLLVKCSELVKVRKKTTSCNEFLEVKCVHVDQDLLRAEIG